MVMNVAQKQLQTLAFNRLINGNIGGSQLVAFDTTSIADGTIATVFSIGALCRLVKTPTAQVTAGIDGITIIASTANPGQVWVRLVDTTDPRFVENIPVYIDPTIGSDDNDGLTALTSLKSADEWCRRMNGQVFTNSIGTVTVTCGAGAIGNFRGCRLICTQNISTTTPAIILFKGTSQQSAQVGTVSSVVAQNPSTNTEFQFTDSSGAGPLISADSRLRIVASAIPSHVGGVGYVRGFGAGGSTNPYTTAFMSDDLTETEFFPSVGDSYVVDTLLTTAQSIALQIENDSLQRFRPFWNNMLIGDPSSSVPGLSGTSTDSVSNLGDPEFLNCTFQPLSLQRIESIFRFVGCKFIPLVETVQLIPGNTNFATCYFVGGFAFTSFCSIIGNCVIEAPSSATEMANAGNLLMSRISSGQAGLHFTSFYYASTIGVIWTPPIGSRNNLSTGMQILSGGAYTQLLINAFHIQASSPVTVANVPTSVFYFDEASGARLAPNTPSLDGVLSFLHDLSSSPSSNTSNGSNRWSVSGSQVARGSGGAISTVVPTGTAGSTQASFVNVQYTGGPVNTAGATTSTIVTSPPLTAPGIIAAFNNGGITVKGIFTGIDGSGNVVSFEIVRIVKRNAGILTTAGAQMTIFAPAGDAPLLGVSGLIDVTGNTIILEATGIGGATIAWTATMTLNSTVVIG